MGLLPSYSVHYSLVVLVVEFWQLSSVQSVARLQWTRFWREPSAFSSLKPKALFFPAFSIFSDFLSTLSSIDFGRSDLRLPRRRTPPLFCGRRRQVIPENLEKRIQFIYLLLFWTCCEALL